jgi:hypothetical protein
MHTCALGKNLVTETEQTKGITKVLSTVTLGSNCIYPKQNVDVAVLRVMLSHSPI